MTNTAINGLAESDAAKLLVKHGENVLAESKKRPVLLRFFDQFKDAMIIILIAAAVVSFALGESVDAIIIVLIVVLNALFGLFQEAKAEEALSALKTLTASETKVIRDGRLKTIPSKDVVPGDVIVLEAGDSVPVDGCILESANLRMEEAALTGESIPVEKTMGDDVFAGTTVVYGRARIKAVGTGMNTQIGKIASMIMNAKPEMTPLQKDISRVGKTIGILVLTICSLLFILTVFQGKPIFETFMLSISIAVAAIPEGLPAIVTVVLAIGVRRMAKKNAIIRKLSAVETLGSASIVCSDKTGTLTQNFMTVVEVSAGAQITGVQDPGAKDLILYAMLCTDATEDIGDPTEIAIVKAAASINLSKKEAEEKLPRVAEVPFDSNRKMMTTVHKLSDGKFRVITKGSVDSILPICKAADTVGIENINKSMAKKALRVIAVGTKIINDLKDFESNLEFVGMLGMIDPPRKEAGQAVKTCKAAGIRPIMITGDHQLTAKEIAKSLDILNNGDLVITGNELSQMSDADFYSVLEKYSVYARVAPEHKVRIIEAWQKKGHIVAMTGDGVNDAPALKRADIGCAMGKVGTEVAKQAADMVLTDDNFATIVAAVKEGRAIYDNIRKAIHFLLSCNMGEVLVFFVAIIFGMESPLIAIQILWINLVTDSFLALALGVEAPDKNNMAKPPRNPKETLFSGNLGKMILLRGILIGGATIACYIFGLRMENLEVARTMAFATLAICQFLAVNSMRSDDTLFNVGFFSNKWMLRAIALSAALMAAVLLIPQLCAVFKVVPLTMGQWGFVMGVSLIPLLVLEFVKVFAKKIKQV